MSVIFTRVSLNYVYDICECFNSLSTGSSMVMEHLFLEKVVVVLHTTGCLPATISSSEKALPKMSGNE